jgi:hypothetical protein
MAGDSSAPRPEPGLARQRGRIRTRLSVGRVDPVFALDVLITFLIFVVDNATLSSPSSEYGGGSSLFLVFVAFITAAPLVLRDSRPLAAWLCSAGAICACTPSPYTGGTASRSRPAR